MKKMKIISYICEMGSCTETYYIESVDDLKERLSRTIAIINALEQRVIDVAAGNADIDEYSLDDGQVKIKTKYRSIDSIADAILRFEQTKYRLLNQLNGHISVLRPARGLE